MKAAEARTAANETLAAEKLAAERERVAEGKNNADVYNANLMRLEAEEKERERRGGENLVREREQAVDQQSTSPGSESIPKASAAQQHPDTLSSGSKRKVSGRQEIDKLGAARQHGRPPLSQASGSPQRPKKRPAKGTLPATTEALGADDDTEMFDAPVTETEQPLTTANRAAALEPVTHTTVKLAHNAANDAHWGPFLLLRLLDRYITRPANPRERRSPHHFNNAPPPTPAAIMPVLLRLVYILTWLAQTEDLHHETSSDEDVKMTPPTEDIPMSSAHDMTKHAKRLDLPLDVEWATVQLVLFGCDKCAHSAIRCGVVQG
ncbi:hypothetical protein LTR78_008782 [Recurvomyces mirabilis]|uniref:Uncharacterized protein n=1 Tax=Recurvomyces mirabilis TaxID=574656 RepID=A0AAE0WGT9_9PEZI|nr:hypothetical protein LTR78_008782 [Recurvomyces mirabilis]KAK5160980.1 hypothetical protein LTS14_000774 [Recurvomyces mirabilis]